MSVYVWPSLIGLIFKLFILIYAAQGRKTSTTLLFLIMVFACHNLIEFIGYIRFLDDQTVAALFRTYYVATIVLLTTLPVHAFFVTKTLADNRAALYGLGTAAAALIVAVLFSDTIIAGNYSIGYSLTAIKGPYYSTFALFLIVALASNAGVLLRGYLRAENQKDSMRCLYSLVALTPLLVTFAFGIIFKVIGVQINLAGVLPLATAFFLFVILKTESKHQLTDIRRFIPFSPERKTSQEILRLLDTYAQNSNQTESFQQLRNGIEREAIHYTLEKCNDNVTQATKMMGLQNRSTLYSMMKRLGIDASKRSENT